MEPCEGDQALRETLDAQGEGSHHIGWLTTDPKGEIERATAKGVRVWTSSFPRDSPASAILRGQR